MDSAKFKEIFSKDDYQLPIRWNGKDFYATLYKHLKDYREDIEKNCDNPNLCAEVKAVCRGICAAVDYSFRGYPEKAYKSFEAVMEILIRNPLLIDEKDINKESLYRVVDVGSAAVPKRQRVFHVPFNMRSKMSTQRYSIPGFPSLYLCTSVDLCCMEIGKNPQHDYVCVSRYELETGNRIISHLIEGNQNPVFDNDEFMIFDISIKPDKAIKKLCHDKKEIIKYIKWYPLISACSYIRAVRDDHIFYSPEYIVPQLFIQWVRSKDEDAVVGIKYFSCASIYASTLGNNYVFPTMGIPYQTRKTITDYCARLSHRFKLTAPKFLMEYESIADCVEAMKKDVNLAYIEDYNIGEGEEIKEDYKIPEGVSSIGAYAFSNCDSMPSISIPDSVTTIGNSAFSSCRKLVGISIPDGVTTIGEKAFFGCSSLASINIPDSVTAIGFFAFSDCSSLANILVNEVNINYTSIDGVLYNRTKTYLLCYPAGKNQTSFAIPSYVRAIGKGAFSGCRNLTDIYIPDSITSIGDLSFFGCSSLTSIKLPNSVTSIGIGVFFDCRKLTSIYIPNTVTSIGYAAFSGCSSLTNIIIPDNLVSISAAAFSDCSSLTKISIPGSVTAIDASAFLGCSLMTNITVNSSNEHYTSVNGILFSKDKTKLLYYPAGKNQTSFAIPSCVTSIGNCAFVSCSSLTCIIIPDSVITIDTSAFLDCSSLHTVFYSGTNEQAEKMKVGVGNNDLFNAEWKYGCSDIKS